jgi:hypothetical protein
VIGVGCGVHKGGIPLIGRMPAQGLPNFVSTFLINDATFNCKPDGIIDSKIKDGGFLLYPNPTNEEFIVEATDAITKVELTDILGRTIQTKNIQSMKYHFHCRELADGIYLVKLNFKNNTTLTQKLIIHHN